MVELTSGLLSILGLLTTSIIISVVFKVFLRRSHLPYPPGPPVSNRLIGNLGDVPFESQWFVFTEWSKVYGHLVYFRMLHQRAVVINRLETAVELLDKRSNNYSSRPDLPMVDLTGWSWVTTFKKDSESWRGHRRLYQKYLKPEVARSYQNIQSEKIYHFLHKLLETPDDFLTHIRHCSGAIIMAMVYGYDTDKKNDYFIEIAEKAIDGVVAATLPGAFLVNVIPILRYVPEWFPGAAFKHLAKNTATFASKMLNEPIQMVQQLMTTGEERPCIAAEMLRNCRSDQELVHIKGVCASGYAGGADTTVSSVSTLFYAFVNFPDTQRKAQEEIDRVIGSERLPTYEDRPHLPYCEAVYRETLRWHPVVPLGVVHTASGDDIYEGYHIPKDTMMIPNIWAMSRDPEKYDDPETFNPSRFLDESGKLNNDEVEYAFGFGRRICPGRHIASATAWLSIVTVLATFDIRKKKDASGEEIPTDKGYSGGLIAHPLPFEAAITPRSDTAKTLILETISQHN